MSDTIADMSVTELREFIDEVIEEKLQEMLGDPNAGLAIRPEVREQLLRQRERARQGNYGVPLSDIPD